MSDYEDENDNGDREDEEDGDDNAGADSDEDGHIIEYFEQLVDEEEIASGAVQTEAGKILLPSVARIPIAVPYHQELKRWRNGNMLYDLYSLDGGDYERKWKENTQCILRLFAAEFAWQFQQERSRLAVPNTTNEREVADEQAIEQVKAHFQSWGVTAREGNVGCIPRAAVVAIGRLLQAEDTCVLHMFFFMAALHLSEALQLYVKKVTSQTMYDFFFHWSGIALTTLVVRQVVRKPMNFLTGEGLEIVPVDNLTPLQLFCTTPEVAALKVATLLRSVCHIKDSFASQ
jgi:hypothetical protein